MRIPAFSPARSGLLLTALAAILVPAGIAAQRHPAEAVPVPREGGVPDDAAAPEFESIGAGEAAPAPLPIDFSLGVRFTSDVDAMTTYRPGYRFWSHVFTRPDGEVVFADARTGELVAAFPTRGNWTRDGWWADDAYRERIGSRPMPSRLSDRRDLIAELLEPVVGEIIHNATRGDFVAPNVRRYGRFLEEWGRIYERFGVPAELGLAQAMVESGFSGDVRSEARAIGFCQWLPQNWTRLDRLSPFTIEVQNQTTQAPYCAAYLAVLATKYGSFIPALSEHHAGSTNVGRTVINGTRLGGDDIRDRYLLGGQFAVDVRQLSPRTFSDVVGTYGPRSYRYAEMILGNAETVARFRGEQTQVPIHAMRVDRDVPLTEVVRVTGLSQDEVKRYNPALVRRVPRSAVLYLPEQVDAFGEDVAFWHRPAPEDFNAVLLDFFQLDAPLEAWDSPDFEPVLQEYRARFRATESEEGQVMDTVLGYVIQEMPLVHRHLSAYRTDPQIESLFERGIQLREAEEQRQREQR